MSPAYLRLKELREARGLTQAALAARARCRGATINDLENHKSRRLDLALLGRLAAALDVEPSELIGSATRIPARSNTRGPKPKRGRK